MDWITFIKWNGIVYASYYGVNLLVDFMISKRKRVPKNSFQTYQLQDLGIDAPQAIKSSDFQPIKEDEPIKVSNPTNTKLDASIAFNAPIERQGIPMQKFIQHALHQGNFIYNQNKP